MSGVSGTQQPGDSKSTEQKLAGSAQPGDSKSTQERLAQPGDSKTTTEKLGHDAKAVGENLQDTAHHYAGKADAKGTVEADNAKKEGAGILASAGDTAAAVGQNLKETADHYAAKSESSTSNTSTTATGDKTFLEQAQEVATNVGTMAQKAVADTMNYVTGKDDSK